eukprot:Skav202798  [mRNA]  locus=scaffold326:728081:730841:+ [translate_table: standard]
MPCIFEIDRTFAATAFFEGTISATFPVIADTYDTLKDVLVGALCVHSSSMVLKVLGITSWLYLAAIHFVFLGWFARVKGMVSRAGNSWRSWWIERVVGVKFLSEGMAARFLTEMLGSYVPVMVCPTALKPGRLQPNAGCFNFLYEMMEASVGIAYKQVTPVKRSLLAIENIFQGLVGIAYIVIEGGSIFVAVLNVAIPILQILLAFCLHKPLRRQAAPWFAKRLKLALENGDLVMEKQIKEEAFEDVGIFTAVAPHLADYDGFTELSLNFALRRIANEGAGELAAGLKHLQQLKLLKLRLWDNSINDAGAAELAAALGQLQQLTKLKLELNRNNIGHAGATALAEAVRRLPRLEEVEVKLYGTALHHSARELQDVERELRSRGCRVSIRFNHVLEDYGIRCGMSHGMSPAAMSRGSGMVG